jgi:hypothetical protein
MDSRLRGNDSGMFFVCRSLSNWQHHENCVADGFFIQFVPTKDRGRVTHFPFTFARLFVRYLALPFGYFAKLLGRYFDFIGRAI